VIRTDTKLKIKKRRAPCSAWHTIRILAGKLYHKK